MLPSLPTMSFSAYKASDCFQGSFSAGMGPRRLPRCSVDTWGISGWISDTRQDSLQNCQTSEWPFLSRHQEGFSH